MKKLAIILALLPILAMAQTDPRYCGPPERDADGDIKRSSYRVYQFKKIYPCPVTGQTSGACPDWSVDHVVPMVCGGCDSVGNMQWLPNKIKSAAGTLPKDRWEQAVYCKGVQ